MRSSVVTKSQFVICVFIAGCGDALEQSQDRTAEPTSIDVIDRGEEAGMKADELEHHDRFQRIENNDEQDDAYFQIGPRLLD